MNRVLVPPLTEPPVRAINATLIELGGPTMGTSWRVHAYAPSGLERGDLSRRINEALDRVIAQMSSWAPGSDLSRFNALAAGEGIGLPQDFETVLACALRVASETGGAIDPTMGALVDLWGFGAIAPRHEVPLDTEINEARAAAGWRKLTIANGRLTQPGVRLDLSGIAKGYAVDLVAEVLREAGAQSFLVEIGGELVGRGVKPDGQPWWVELEQPPGCDAPRTIVALHNLAIATSGDYRRNATLEGGETIVHTIDPATGRPLANCVASVSVLHASCMEADAYATALTVLGGEHAMDFADARGIAMRCLERSADGFVERRSRAFDLMLEDAP